MYSLAKPIIRNNITDKTLNEAKSIIENSENICVLTGAGISTDSGIPDFRGPQGLWTKNPSLEATADITSYLNSRTIRDQFWASGGFAGISVGNPAPNKGHKALVELERQGKLLTLVTQNVDGLHQLAGNSEEKVVEAHGNLREAICYSCGEIYPIEEGTRQYLEGKDPHCVKCNGLLKANAVFFGEYLAPKDVDRAYISAVECDMMLVVGTSLRVPPICEIVNRAYDTSSTIVIVNQQSTEKDRFAKVKLRDEISDILPRII